MTLTIRAETSDVVESALGERVFKPKNSSGKGPEARLCLGRCLGYSKEDSVAGAERAGEGL